jgi:hypothetical protein
VALALPAASAGAPLAVTPLGTVPMQHSVYPPRPYTMAADGTFWVAEKTGTNTGQVVHYDDEGNNLGNGFSFNYSGFVPFSIGVHGNRIFITMAQEAAMVSYEIATADPEHNRLITDFDTNRRDINGWMRVYGDGSATFALGEKVAVADLTDESTEHPFYPQTYYGAGINKALTENNTYLFESCALGLGGVVLGEPDPNCGAWSHVSGPGAPTGFSVPTDLAPAPGGLLITEKGADRVTHLNGSSAGGQPDYEFGGPGEGAGQLLDPVSIVGQPNSSDYFIGEEGNRRVSVFTSGGAYVGSFGYGVSDGADAIEVCGIGLGDCRAGISSMVDPRSSVGRLDFGPEGNLYVFNPIADQIQVFAVSGGETSSGIQTGAPGPIGGGAVPTGAGGGSPASVAPKEADKVRLRAQPLKVKKGEKSALTAVVKPAATCTARKVLFQAKDQNSWDNLGKSIRVGKSCQVGKQVTISTRSVFRVILLDTKNSHTLGQSPNVTVTLK